MHTQPRRARAALGWIGWAVAALLLGWFPCPASGQAGEPGATAVTETPRIRPGDQISLRVWREPTLSDVFVVAESGEVILPRLGAVRVAGREVGEVADSLRAAYAAYLRNPSITITVLRRVGVQGEVRAPGLYMVDLTYTLREVILQAGGIAPSGNPRRIHLVRNGEVIRLDAARGDQLPAAMLQSGDQVVVGRRNWLAANPLAVFSIVSGVVSLAAIVIPLL